MRGWKPTPGPACCWSLAGSSGKTRAAERASPRRTARTQVMIATALRCSAGSEELSAVAMRELSGISLLRMEAASGASSVEPVIGLQSYLRLGFLHDPEAFADGGVFF